MAAGRPGILRALYQRLGTGPAGRELGVGKAERALGGGAGTWAPGGLTRSGEEGHGASRGPVVLALKRRGLKDPETLSAAHGCTCAWGRPRPRASPRGELGGGVRWWPRRDVADGRRGNATPARTPCPPGSGRSRSVRCTQVPLQTPGAAARKRRVSCSREMYSLVGNSGKK